MTGGTVPDLVACRRRSTPHAEVLTFEGGPSYSASELDDTVAERAGVIAQSITEDESRVAIVRTSRAETLLDVLATIRAGGVPAPLDPQLDQRSLESRIHMGGIEHIILGEVPQSVPEGVPADLNVIPTEADAQPVVDRTLQPHTPMTLMFTSGTLVLPEPVVHTAWNHVAGAIASADRIGVEPTDRWYDPLGLHHMGGLAPVTRCLIAGIPLVVAKEVSADGLFHRIDATDATIASIVPTMLHRALDTNAPSPPTLRCLLVGGAPLHQARFEQAHDRDIPVWATYGLTETVGQVTTANPRERIDHPGTVGTPVLGVTVRIVDDDESVPPGTVGTIEVAGQMVVPTTGSDTPHRSEPLRTTDLGYLDETGRLWVVGRSDDVIQTGGTLVHPLRVQQTIERHPMVAEAAVIGLEDETWGERVVAAVVTTNDDARVDDILAHCKEHLPAYAVPKRIDRLDTIPRTPSGTVDREALRERLTR